MKKLLIATVAGLVACQPLAEPAAISRAAVAARVVPTPPIAAPTLALLREHDLAPLLQGTGDADSEIGDEANEPFVFNGFFGPAHYRFALVLLEVRRDPQHLLLYHVRGKSCFKGAVLPFSGTIRLTQLLEQPHYSAPEVAASQRAGEHLSDIDQELYTAVGQFELREPTGQLGAGIFRGEVAVDFGLVENGTLEYNWRTGRTLAQQTKLKYEGAWTSSATGRQQAILWAKELFSHPTVEALDMFELGDRERTIRPAYARLGWDEYWRNDEWWADSPKPNL